MLFEVTITLNGVKETAVIELKRLKEPPAKPEEKEIKPDAVDQKAS